MVYHLAGGWSGIADSDKLLAQPDFLTVTGIAPSDLFVYLLTIGAYQFVLQDLWQRFWAAKNAQAAYSSYAVVCRSHCWHCRCCCGGVPLACP